MGQTLDKPVTKKITVSGVSSYLAYGCSGMQGVRMSMEDEYSTVARVDLPQGMREVIDNGSEVEVAFFGVYDGHSGSACAKYLGEHLLDYTIQDELEYRKNARGRIFSDNQSIQQSFMKTDNRFANSLGSTLSKGDSSGTTCTSTIVIRHKNHVEIVCANVGDSRTVFRHRNGRVEALSDDHKPNNELERNRIMDSGGFVNFGRVNGSLALSRAFGDLGYKTNSNLPQDKQAVIAKPDIERIEFDLLPSIENEKDNYEFLILACDGIWDVMTNEEACEFVVKKLKEQKQSNYYQNRINRLLKALDTDDENYLKEKENIKEINDKRAKRGGIDLESICEDLLDECVLVKQSKDNTTVVIVLFSSDISKQVTSNA